MVMQQGNPKHDMLNISNTVLYSTALKSMLISIQLHTVTKMLQLGHFIPFPKPRGLGVELTLRAIPVKKMLEGKNCLLGKPCISKVREEIYDGLVGYIEIDGYLDPDFKESNINNLVLFTIYPILRFFKHHTARNLRLRRDKEIVSVDSAIGGYEEFLVMDRISVGEKNPVLIVEATRKQCFLSMRDMQENKGGGTIYGFITTGDSWRMVTYDGTFKIIEKMELLFDTMDGGLYSVLVDCLNGALSNGGI